MPYTESHRQCYFKVCRYLAEKDIMFKGNLVKVCKKHAKTYGTSHEAEQRRG